MHSRLVSLFVLLAAAVLVASSPTASSIEPRDSPEPAFQLDLSKRFSSTVALLKSRRGPTKTSKVGITKKRSLSDELLSMLKSAAVMLSPSASPHPSASANAHAASRPSASAAASPWASGVSAAKPSGSLQPSSVKAARANVEYVKRKIQDTPWEVLDSRLLCPLGETACPIFPRMGTYECLDTSSELESCGGCLSKGDGEDCTAIKGAQGVTCESGGCFVFTCQPGYKYDGDFKRSNGGKGRCVARSSSSTKERRSSPAAVVAESAELEKREPAPEPAAAVGGSV